MNKPSAANTRLLCKRGCLFSSCVSLPVPVLNTLAQVLTGALSAYPPVYQQP
jgi:hypothetical protein